MNEDYIQDDFNLTGLNGLVPYYDYALDMVLDVEMPMEDSLTEEQRTCMKVAQQTLPNGKQRSSYCKLFKRVHGSRPLAFQNCAI